MSSPIDDPESATECREADDALMSGLARGDHQALSTLMGLHWGAVVSYAHGFLGVDDAAEDVAQTSFVRLWEGRLRWRSGSTARGLLFRIARNLALNERRHLGVRADWEQRSVPLSGGAGALPPEELEAEELRLAAGEAIRSLPPRRREVFELARFHGLSYRQIGEALDISPQTVANQMSAAMAELRERLSPFLEEGPLPGRPARRLTARQGQVGS